MMRTKTSEVIVQITPPLLLPVLRSLHRWARGHGRNQRSDPTKQDLDVYWDPAMAQVLETWGEGNVWNEIALIMAGRKGRVLDIACGTGKALQILSDNPELELWGCDISDLLIERAVQRGLAPERLHVGDATKLPYPDGHFDYSYSIGSIEHFTEGGIAAMLAESRRVTRRMAFHTHPVSRNGHDEGWITTVQSYFNNSVEWWLSKYRASFATVKVLESSWNDHLSVGKWFMCS
jgi:ubiquinone/menaquinone biosynthesis C-methylase UbiE